MTQMLISDQATLLLFSLCFGGMLGAYYDIFRILRAIGFNGKRQIISEDIFFFLSCTPFVFLFYIAFNNGYVDLLSLLVIGIGGLIYRLSVGSVTLWIVKKLLKPIRLIFSYITKPLKAVDLFIFEKSALIFSKIKSDAKTALKSKSNNRKKKAKPKSRPAKVRTSKTGKNRPIN